jgi:hypothetical protein
MGKFWSYFMVQIGKLLPVWLSRLMLVLVVAGLLSGQTPDKAYAQTEDWSEPVMLGPGWFPDITTDLTGKVHVAWSSSFTERDPNVPSLFATRRGYDLLMYRYTYDGIEWSDAYDIVAFRQTAGSEVTRPALLIDADGVFHITYRYNSIYYNQAPVDSATSAKAWRNSYRQSVDQVAYFSRIAQDSQGRLHIVFTENVRSFDCPICYHLFYRWSDDNGRNWSIRTDISALPIGVAKPQMLIDAFDNIHVVWEAGRGGALGQLTDPTTVMYAASYDGGVTWSRPVEFFVPDGRAKNITIGVDGLGQLVVAWLALPENRIYYQVSNDYGRSWSEAELIPGVRGSWAVYNSRLDHYTMATDSAGSVHLVLVGKATDERGTLDVIHLNWNGIDWSEPEVITSYLGDAPEWPRIAVANGNQLHVVWFVRDEDHIFDSDRGDYYVWYSQRTINAPAIEPITFPTATPAPIITPTPTYAPPTPTPVDPSIALTPVSPDLALSVYGELDELALMGRALIPAAIFILLVFAIIRIRRK